MLPLYGRSNVLLLHRRNNTLLLHGRSNVLLLYGRGRSGPLYGCGCRRCGASCRGRCVRVPSFLRHGDRRQRRQDQRKRCSRAKIGLSH
jgi:hypothetical protein